MKILGWLLFLVGTLVASAAGAKVPPSWVVFGVGAAVATAGAIVLRVHAARAAGAGDAGSGIRDLAGLRKGLDAIGVGISDAAASEGDDALKVAVEATILERMIPVIEARMILSQAHGVESYAKVFTPLAACERCLNRAWSALVDGHPPESRAQLVAAQAHLAIAQGAWPAV
jgi:hypothetical protein